MATRTFVADGTSRNWSATTTWAEGAIPTAADDVVFSTNVVSSILVIDGTSGSPSLCKSIDTTNYTRTITFGAGKELDVGGSTSGAFKLTAGLTFAPSSTSLIKFVSTTTGNNITLSTYTTQDMTFDGVGGGWVLQSSDANSSGNWILTNGSLNFNGFSIGSTNGISLSSNNSNIRTLNLGSGTINIGAPNGLNLATTTNLTFTGSSSTITMGSSLPVTFAGGGLTFGTLTATPTAVGTITLTGANTFSTLTFAFTVAGTRTTLNGFKLSADQTVTGTFTASANSLILRNFIYSDVIGTPRTISAGTFAITNTDLRDITKAGAGSGNISATSATTGNGDCGGNTGWTFQGARNVYMKTAVSVNWSGTNWFTASGGSTAAVPPLPLCHDTAIFDVNSVTAASKTITIDQPRIAGSIWTGVANTPTLTAGATWETYGGLILGTVSISSDANAVAFKGRGSNTFTQNGNTWPNSKPITIDLSTGTLTLGSNFSSLAAGTFLTMTSGTFAGAGFTFNFGGNSSQAGGTISGFGASTIGGSWTQTGGTFTLGGTQTISAALALSGGTLNMNGNQITGHTTATISSTGTLNLSGQLNGSGAISVTGGTINDQTTTVTGELKGTTGSFSGGTSVVKKLTLSSTMAMSSTASLTIPAGGSATWATSWTNTGTTYSLKFGGVPSFVNGALTVGAGFQPGLEGV